MPEISVIVPVYKAESHINRCVDSILAQTFTGFELILVDDGSPDRSGAICDEYACKDSRVRVVHKPNGGVSSARNAGLDAAKGNWITFVDSDDYIAEAYLADLYAPTYDLVIGSYAEVLPFENTTTPLILQAFTCDLLDTEQVQRLIKCNEKKWIYCCWGRLYRRSIIENNHIRFDTRYYSGEDTVFMAEYFICCNSVKIIEEANYFYVLQKCGTLSTTYDVGYLDSMVQTEAYVAEVMQSRFSFAFPQKTGHELCLAYAGCLGSIAVDPYMSFFEKIKSFRYLFRNPYFLKAISDPDVYFSSVSSVYRCLLRVKSPLLMLIALRISSWLKRKF